jgi:predicted amidohydrolase YtcJ
MVHGSCREGVVRAAAPFIAEASPSSVISPQLQTIGFGDDHVTVRAIKKAIDGALGPHGAWLLEPYSDLPTSNHAGRPLHLGRSLGDKRLGERRAREGAYVWQSLLKTGAVVTNGTDAPVEDASPVASFYAAVSRMTVPEEDIPGADVVYTIVGGRVVYETK